MFVFKYLSAYLILAFFSIADSCQPPTPLQFGSSYHEQVHGVQNHASYSPENNVDYDPNYSNRVDTVPQGPVAAGVLPNSPANPIPVPPLTFTPHNQQPPKDPFSLFGGATGSSIGKECKEDEIRNVEEFLGCTEIQPSDADSENSRFGTEKCDFEPGVVCRFYTSPDEPLKFELGRFNVPKDSQTFATKFAELTQRPVGSTPNNTFMIVSVPKGTNAKNQAVLQADIGCQKRNGKMSFDYWSTYDRLIVKVCTRNEYERSCTQNIEYYASTTRVEVDVIHPETDKFTLEVIVYGFSSPAAFILDNLEYEAELCEDLQANEIQQPRQPQLPPTTTIPSAIQQGVTAMTKNAMIPQQNPVFDNFLVQNPYPIRPVQLRQQVEPAQKFNQVQQTQNFLNFQQIQQPPPTYQHGHQLQQYPQGQQPQSQQYQQAQSRQPQQFSQSQQFQQSQEPGSSRRWQYPQYQQQNQIQQSPLQNQQFPREQNWTPSGVTRPRYVEGSSQYARPPIQGLQEPVAYQNVSRPVGLDQNIGQNQNYQSLNENWSRFRGNQQYSRHPIQELRPALAYQNVSIFNPFGLPQRIDQTPQFSQQNSIPQNNQQQYAAQQNSITNNPQAYARQPLQVQRLPNAFPNSSNVGIFSQQIDKSPQEIAFQDQETYQNVSNQVHNVKYPYYENLNNVRSPWHRNPWSMRNNQYPLPPRFNPLALQSSGNISNQAFYGKSSKFPPKLAYGLPNPGISKPLMKSDSSDLFPSVTFGRLAIKKMTPCDILSCSFGRSLCHYTQPLFHGDVNHGKWQISHTPIGNRHTGIHNGTVDQRSAHGGFAFVGTDKNEPKQKGRTIYILESPFFTLNEDTTLNFDLYRRASAITLQICFDNMMNCPYEAPPLNKDVYWREGESVLMPKGTSKVYFVATQWKRFKWLAIDNVTINKGRACSSSNEEIRKLANLRL